MANEKEIENEFQQQIENLKESIERVGMRQDELKSYIYNITSSSEQIQLQINSLPADAYKTKSNLYLALNKNNELIARLYDTISSFEAVRHRYQQDIGRLTKDKIFFLNVELKRVENKMETTSTAMAGFIKELRNFVTTVSNVETRPILASLENSPEYSLD